MIISSVPSTGYDHIRIVLLLASALLCSWWCTAGTTCRAFKFHSGMWWRTDKLLRGILSPYGPLLAQPNQPN